MTEKSEEKNGRITDRAGDLKPGQNFFDQEPFRTVVRTIAERTGKDPAKLRHILGVEVKFLRKLHSPSALAANKENRERALKGDVYGDDDKPSPLGIPPEEKAEYEKAAQEMIDMLKPYPSWSDYLRITLSNLGDGYGHIYRADGNVKETFQYNAPAFLFPPNYLKWIKRKAELKRREINQRLIGIDEIFTDPSLSAPRVRTQESVTEHIPIRGGKKRR